MAAHLRDVWKYVLPSLCVAVLLLLYLVQMSWKTASEDSFTIEFTDEESYQQGLMMKKQAELNSVDDLDFMYDAENYGMKPKLSHPDYPVLKLNKQGLKTLGEHKHRDDLDSDLNDNLIDDSGIQQKGSNLDYPEKYTLNYKGKRKTGLSLTASIQKLKKLPNSPMFASSAIDWDKPTKDLVFAHGSSSNHFKESNDAIAGVQKLLPGQLIYYYDLGLKPDEVKVIKTWCNVKYRKFDFSLYPSHVSVLFLYAFKPMIIQDLLQDHYNVVWMDASFRLKANNLSPVYHMAENNGGIVLFKNSANLVVASTNPNLYEYIPTSLPDLRTILMAGAGALFVRNTKEIYNNVLYWWFLCALERDCIAPAGHERQCRRANPKNRAAYLGCHRYDQSTINVLMANYHHYNRTRYATTEPSQKNPFVSIVRSSRQSLKVKVCN